jgi:hypothetical protein
MKTNKLKQLVTDLSCFRLSNNSPSGLIWAIVKPLARVKIGSIAGSLTVRGYYQVKLNGRCYKAHRIIYAIHNNITIESMDGQTIDHIDGNRSNNKPDNLRLCTVHENNQNKTKHRDGHLVGTTFDGKAWKAQIQTKGKTKHLGRFQTQIAANNAYLQAYTELVA